MLPVSGDKLHGLVRDPVGDPVVLPQGRLAALHIPDAGNPVDDGLVVPVGRGHYQQFGIVPAGRLALEGFGIAHGDGIGRIKPDDALVFDIYAGHTVARGGHDERIIEPYIAQARRNDAVPILPGRLAQAQMPLSDGSGGVARAAQHVGQRILFGRYDHSGIPRRNPRPFLAPRILSRQQSVAGGRTGRRGRMGIGETHAFGSQPVYIRRLYRG